MVTLTLAALLAGCSAASRAAQVRAGSAANQAAALCFPALQPTAVAPPATQSVTETLPADLPQLLLIGTDGQLWVLSGEVLTRWTTGEVTGGYEWGQWQAGGSILASTVAGGTVRLDRLSAPGRATPFVTLPYTVKASAPAGFCPINGYLTGFAASPEGLILLRHSAGPIEHSCPPLPPGATEPPWRCASPEGLSMEVRTADGAPKPSLPPYGLFAGPNAPSASQTAVVAAHANPVAGMVLGGEISTEYPVGDDTCCETDSAQKGTAFAFSPDGSQLAVATRAGEVRVVPTATPMAVGRLLWTSPGPVTALALTAGTLAVAHGSAVTLVAVATGAAVTLELGALGPMTCLDWDS
ncbi:MAG TPA: hypothetical protein VFW71_04005 [Actinomycetota bacterium]|nr:hypothetical protein [Actinomycetota bacterium]